MFRASCSMLYGTGTTFRTSGVISFWIIYTMHIFILYINMYYIYIYTLICMFDFTFQIQCCKESLATPLGSDPETHILCTARIFEYVWMYQMQRIFSGIPTSKPCMQNLQTILLSFILLHILLRTKKCTRVPLQLLWFFAFVAARQADVQDVPWQTRLGRLKSFDSHKGQEQKENFSS